METSDTPQPAAEHFGPLARLAGAWEGEGGTDFSFHHADGADGVTQYLERITFNPFGPVDNGTQSLYGLDYRMAAWRDGEDDPFHTEVGYWLYDASEAQIMRCFMVPRGVVVIAGGTATRDATSFTLEAELGSTTYGVLSNRYLDKAARTESYSVQVTIGDDEFSYSEDTVLRMAGRDELLHHTDVNRLKRVAI